MPLRRETYIRKHKWSIFAAAMLLVALLGAVRFNDFGTMDDPAISGQDVTGMLAATALVLFMNTNMAGAAAMLTWIFFDRLRGRKVSAIGAGVGAVVGLVAITPAAGYVSVGASIFIGTAAAIASNIAVHWKDKSSLDDALDVFPSHGVGGIVGMLLTAVFARNVGLLYGHSHTLLMHLLALFIVGVYTFGGSLLLYWLTNKLIPLRVSQKSEILGLDLSQHDELYALPQDNDLKTQLINSHN